MHFQCMLMASVAVAGMIPGYAAAGEHSRLKDPSPALILLAGRNPCQV